MSEAPAPPVSIDTRAKGWRFELDHERIRQSDTWALAPADARPWLLMLWMVAWEQTPCGSLPADDGLIAARIGMAPRAFTKHRDVLLRGWWLASDGRLYHAVITEHVAEMVERRKKDAERRAGNRAKHRDTTGSPGGVPRDSTSGVPRDSTPRHDTGTGTRTRREKETLPLSRPKPEPKGSRLSAEWAPGEPGLAYAASIGLSNGRASAELEKFRDHWFAKAGKDGVKADWMAAWRTWCRNALSFAAGKQGARVADPFEAAH